MIITSVETLRCGAGFRDFCFVKICTDGTSPDGKPIVGWSEYLEERNIGITQVIEWMGELVTGQDPLPFEKILSNLRAVTRHVVGGIAAQGIAAIENGILDVVGKFYGVPVCALFGGPVRTELEVYWSHCGSFRVSYADQLQNPDTGAFPVPPLQTLDDMRKLGEEVKASGWKALKTNIFEWADEQTGAPASMYMAGFGGGLGGPELNVQQDQIDQLVEQMRALRAGCGDSVGMKLDLNYNFKTDGYIRIAQALTPEALGGTGIDWLELDLYDPNALRQIRCEVLLIPSLVLA